MSSTASRMFEAALQGGAFHNSSEPAAQAFELLLKAKRAGRGSTGANRDDREFQAPHTVHGMRVRMFQPAGGSRPTPVHEGNRLWDHADASSEYTVVNRFDQLSRMGHEVLLGATKGNFDHPALQGYEHPDSPHHLAYIYKLTHDLLNPAHPHAMAGLAGKEGGRSFSKLHQEIGAGRHLIAGNQAGGHQNNRSIIQAATLQPRTMGQWHNRALEGPSKARSAHVEHFITQLRKSALFTAGLNRAVATARHLGRDKMNGISGAEFTHHMHEMGPLHLFSQRNVPAGFHDDLLWGKKHYTEAHKDFAGGKPNFKAIDLYSDLPHAYKYLGPKRAARLNNPEDVLHHVASLEVADGRGHVGMEEKPRLLHDYVTKAHSDIIASYGTEFGAKHAGNESLLTHYRRHGADL
jgi:hypothetical protein